MHEAGQNWPADLWNLGFSRENLSIRPELPSLDGSIGLSKVAYPWFFLFCRPKSEILLRHTGESGKLARITVYFCGHRYLSWISFVSISGNRTFPIRCEDGDLNCLFNGDSILLIHLNRSRGIDQAFHNTNFVI
jgi:hypothetical protein